MPPLDIAPREEKEFKKLLGRQGRSRAVEHRISFTYTLKHETCGACGEHEIGMGRVRAAVDQKSKVETPRGSLLNPAMKDRQIAVVAFGGTGWGAARFDKQLRAR